MSTVSTHFKRMAGLCSNFDTARTSDCVEGDKKKGSGAPDLNRDGFDFRVSFFFSFCEFESLPQLFLQQYFLPMLQNRRIGLLNHGPG